MTNNEILKLDGDAATKALTDVEFRRRMAADGNKTIKEEYGKECPVKVTFHEVTDKKLPFVLPAKAKDGELGDDVLRGVSGGVALVTAVKHLRGSPWNGIDNIM